MSTLLLIPGLLCDETVWQPLIKTLELQSIEVADLSTQDDLTAMAMDCLDSLSGSLMIAGHSMGARVAMEAARIAPERVSRLALLDTGIHPLRDGETVKREASIEYANAHGMQALAERWLDGMVYGPNKEDRDLMNSLTDMVLRCDPALYARQIHALVNRPDASSYIATISCPTLLLVGRQDLWSPVSQHERMQQLLPDARLEVIEDAGHFSLLEQSETVTRLLAEFFA